MNEQPPDRRRPGARRVVSDGVAAARATNEVARLRAEASAVDLAAERIVHRTNAAALATGRDNTIVSCNSHLTRLLGYQPADLLGHNLQDVLQARDVFGNSLARDHGAFHEMAARFEALQSFKLDVRTRKGDTRRVGVSVAVVVGAEESQHCLVYLLTPIQRRRRADQLIDQLLAGVGVSMPGGHFTGEDARGVYDAYHLTERQREVLLALSEGHSAAEIADSLGLSIHTVRSHLRAILETLDVKNQIEAVAKALALRLI